MARGGMIRELAVLAVLVCALFLPVCAAASGPVAETRDLLVSAPPGGVPDGQLRALAGQTQALLDRILEFWSMDSGVERFGKIRILFDESRRGQCTSVFYWNRDSGRPVREVRVSGCADAPQMLAHKLTSAVFPQKDKLLRNMLGILSETRLGNPATFPLCGIGADAWGAALIRTKTFIPLRDLGPDDASWGMEEEGGRVTVFDRARQHAAYAEAGSFAEFLFRTYGLEKLRRLQRLSQDRPRPMQEVFGESLEALEARWLDALQRDGAALAEPLAAQLLREDRAGACEAARHRSAGRQ